MSCYFRHLKDVLGEAGIEVNSSTREDIDRAFHRIVGVTYKDCPTTWKRLNQGWTAEENKRRQLAQNLRNAAN